MSGYVLQEETASDPHTQDACLSQDAATVLSQDQQFSAHTQQAADQEPSNSHLLDRHVPLDPSFNVFCQALLEHLLLRILSAMLTQHGHQSFCQQTAGGS